MRKITKSKGLLIETFLLKFKAHFLRVRYIILYILSLGVVFLSLQVTIFFKDSGSLYSIVEELNKLYVIKQTQTEGSFEGMEKIPPLEVDVGVYTEKNNETVGFLTIPYIELGLPVVQTSNNEYYLTHDFYKKENALGWVFLDTRSYNKAKEDNSVIYGHNVTTNNMFGNLKSFLNLTEEDLKDKEEALHAKYMYYNTENESRTYEIISAYVTHFENWSYVQNRFDSKEKIEFIDMIKKANKVDAFKNVGVRANDKILTLSTCYGVLGTTKRMVIHAKLITEVYN